MNIRTRFCLAFCCMLLLYSGFCQNDLFFSHYMFNPSYYNPGWIGVEDEAFIAGHFRAQWVGYETSFDGSGAAPSSQLVSLVIPSLEKISGYGLAISNDPVAHLHHLQIRPSIAYAKEFRGGEFSLGLMPALIFQSLDFGQLRSVEPEPDLPGGRESQTELDLNAGIFFQSSNNYFLGVSLMNILQPSFQYGTQLTSGSEINNLVERTYALTGGTQFSMSRDLKIRPSTLIRTDLKSLSYEFSVIAMYDDYIWGGISYRRAESVVLLLGYSFFPKNRFKFGYAFDYVVNDREAKQPTSHEFFLRYGLPELVVGGKKAIKTPRFPL